MTSSEATRQYWARLTPEQYAARAPKRIARSERDEAEQKKRDDAAQGAVTARQRAANAAVSARESQLRQRAEQSPVTENMLVRIGALVRKHRSSEYGSQLELADAVGLRENDINAIEIGKGFCLNFRLLAAIAVELELSAGELIG